VVVIKKTTLHDRPCARQTLLDTVTAMLVFQQRTLTDPNASGYACQ